jgi:hypothetical protein
MRTEGQNRAFEYLLKEGFSPVNGEAYPLFKSYDQGNSLLEISAVTSITWAFEFNAVYKVIEGYLCSVWFYPEGTVYFCLQSAGGNGIPRQSIIDTLYGLSLGAGLPFLRIAVIEERALKEYQELEAYDIKSEYNDDYSEYAYRTRDILEWSGSINFYKRKRLKKCFEVPDISLAPMTRENIQVCFEIEEEWCRRQDCAYCGSFFGCEKKALENMAGIFDEGIHTGLFLYHRDNPAGYIICEKISEKLAFLYFGKVNLDDFFLYLIYMTVKTYFSEIEYLNIGHDMGKAGLRTFKKHLSAHELWRKYTCAFVKAGGEKT